MERYLTKTESIIFWRIWRIDIMQFNLLWSTIPIIRCISSYESDSLWFLGNNSASPDRIISVTPPILFSCFSPFSSAIRAFLVLLEEFTGSHLIILGNSQWRTCIDPIFFFTRISLRNICKSSRAGKASSSWNRREFFHKLRRLVDF